MGKPKRHRERKDDGDMNSGEGKHAPQRKKQKKGGANKIGKRNQQPNKTADLLVRVTRVELTDDHTHAPAPVPASEPTQTIAVDNSGVNDNNNSSATTEKVRKATDELLAEKNEHESVCLPIKETKAPVKTPKEKGKKAESSSEPVTEPCDKQRNRKPYIKVIKEKSARHNPKNNRKKKFDKNYKPLPDGDCGDGIKNPHDKDQVPDKFWAQRRRLFSRYDEGIQLDKESWYSVTPEAIANHIAERMAKICKEESKDGGSGAVILDAFCGCGGNAIAFAQLPKEDVSLVVCIDIDRSKLEKAAKNAELYGVDRDRIVFIEGDAVSAMKFAYDDGVNIISATKPSTAMKGDNEKCREHEYIIGGFDLLPTKIDAVFLSPPWGGMDYSSTGKFGYDISKHIKLDPANGGGGGSNSIPSRKVVNGEELLAIASNASSRKFVTYFLPKNTNGVSLGNSAFKVGYRDSIELEQNFLNGKHKTNTAYMRYQ